MRKLLITATILIYSLSYVNTYAQIKSHSQKWKHDYNGNAWVRNASLPNKITQGLNNRHIALWASHGRYFDNKKEIWKWQRPNLFSTNEDLYTQTIVVPFLIPMLQNAGAIVFYPRERDLQKHEVIIDNDTHRTPTYRETTGREPWQTCPSRGFAQYKSIYNDRENPFEAGTARVANSTKSKHTSTIVYQPDIPEAGRYAVYVSYQTLRNSIDDAEYIVNHKGQSTRFIVNQQMGGGTWVYLGTFEFDKGCSQFNNVVLTNTSKKKGVVTADAVRFGGGMGNIQRGGSTSGLPRALEGARYYAQWAGAPYNVYSSKNGTDDYSDDINVRSFFLNYLAGGSVFVPHKDGKNVPIELSLAVHSDAGYSRDGKSLTGTLSICTTNHNEGKLNSGLSRNVSHHFADLLLNTINNDLQQKYGRWTKRAIWDKNYSETRVPEVPSAIIETLSHQNFPDMRYGQDPNFRFTMARAIYKTILKFVAEIHNKQYIVQPLPPKNFRIERQGKDKIILKWNGVTDSLEPTSKASSYKVYTAIGNSAFDNGQIVKGNQLKIKIEPATTYHFKVAAVNKGGESFTTETLSAEIGNLHAPTILIVNGFGRLASPAVIDNESQQGFDLETDPGVGYGLTAGWCGQQLSFDKSKMGQETSDGLGFSGNEMAGLFIAGNDFNYVKTHANAIHATGMLYNVMSCSREAIEDNNIDMRDYDCVDIVFGLEKDDGYSLKPYKTFSQKLSNQIVTYLQHGGRLFASGAYIASDMKSSTEQTFLNQWFKTEYGGSLREDKRTNVYGMNTSMEIYRNLNGKHYAATSVDILHPTASAICAMQYADGSSAATAYKSPSYRTFLLGFPFECVTTQEKRNWIMKAILAYLLN